MYIELKCYSCGKSFRCDFTNSEYETTKCPKCGKPFNSSDVSRIRTLTETFYTNAVRTSDVQVYGVHAEENVAVGTAIISNDLFSADMEHLDKIYRTSSPAVQNKLAALMDKFYLLVNHDAQSENLEKLDETLKQFRVLFMDRVRANQQEMKRILEPDLED